MSELRRHTIGFLPDDRRARLRRAVQDLLAAAIRGEVTPDLVELDALTEVCLDAGEGRSAQLIAAYVLATGLDRAP